MPSTDYLTGPASGEIRWYPEIDGLPPADPPRQEPGPRAWNAAVAGLAEAAGIKKIAASLPEGDPRSQLEASAARTVDRILDDWCGSRNTWPGAGPPPWSIALAAQLAAMATAQPAG